MSTPREWREPWPRPYVDYHASNGRVYRQDWAGWWVELTRPAIPADHVATMHALRVQRETQQPLLLTFEELTWWFGQ